MVLVLVMVTVPVPVPGTGPGPVTVPVPVMVLVLVMVTVPVPVPVPATVMVMVMVTVPVPVPVHDPDAKQRDSARKEVTMRLIFYYPHNRILRHDGDEFAARALDAAKYWSYQNSTVIPVQSFAIPKGNDAYKRAYIIAMLRTVATGSVDRVGIFCHGTADWCDAGIRTTACSAVADELHRVCTPDARIGLYCCATGARPDGLAATLAHIVGVPVMAHITSGHTTRNPFKRWFANGTFRNLCPPKNPERKAWIDALKTDRNKPFEILERVLP